MKFVTYLLIKDLALELLCASQISIQMTTMSNFGEALIILGFDVRTTSLKMWVDYKIYSTISEKTRALVSSMMYGIHNILR